MKRRREAKGGEKVRGGEEYTCGGSKYPSLERLVHCPSSMWLPEIRYSCDIAPPLQNI